MLARFNLTAVLAFLAIANLVLDRLFAGLFYSADSSRTGAQAVVRTGAFVSHLAGALALLLFATTFAGLLRRRELYPRSLRLVTSVLAVFFVVLFTACISGGEVPTRRFTQLSLCQAFLMAMTALAVWRLPASAWRRLGVSLFALPLVLHAGALFLVETGSQSELAARLVTFGQLCAFLAAGAAPLLLRPARRTKAVTIFAWVVGLVAVALLLAVAAARYDLVQVFAYYGFGIDLPARAATGCWAFVLLLCLAVLGVALTVLPDLAAGGSDRLAAYGIVLLVAAGCHVGSPWDLGIATCGVLALAVSVARPPVAAVPPVPSGVSA